MVDPVSLGPARPVQSRTHMVAKAESFSPRQNAVQSHPGPSLPRLVSLAAELASQGPPVDEARIAHIRNAIALGTYKIDPALIGIAILSYYDGTSK